MLLISGADGGGSGDGDGGGGGGGEQWLHSPVLINARRISCV